MQSKVMTHFGIHKNFRKAGFLETDLYKNISVEIKAAIEDGQLIVLSGIVGSGKTALLCQLKSELIKERKFIVSEALTMDKDRANLSTLISALYFDLSPDKAVQIPSHGEKQARGLKKLIEERKKPIAFFIDEAHDLHHKTLKGLKRLMEMAKDSKNTLSIILAGHPKLKNDLRQPVLEEIGYRTTIFSIEGLQGKNSDYIHWLLQECAKEKMNSDEIIEPEAIHLLAEKLMTPLQIEQLSPTL